MQDTIAIDLAKSVFHVAISHQPGRVAQHHRLSRVAFQRFMARRERAHVLMEACSSAHHWGREFLSEGHTVSLLPPHHVRRYRSTNKTDRIDAKALLEAFRNEDIHLVPIKSVDQQTLAAIHRLRSAWMGTRTARINAVRGLLRELGITIPVGARHLLPHLQTLSEESLPAPMKHLLTEVAEDIRDLERRIRVAENQLQALARQTPAVGHLQSVPGIGLLTATALVAFVGDVRRFPSGRHFASYLGITPREHSSGSIRRLGRISKRGDVYLRMLLIHGARSVLWAAKAHKSPDPFRDWAVNLEKRRGHNIAAVAVANKLARFVWRVWREDRDFRRVA